MHAGQVRGGNGGKPYVHHCFDVARRVSEAGVDDLDVLAAAILHDTVEDTNASLEQLTVKYGKRVAKLVEALTVPKSIRTWQEKDDFQIAQMKSGTPELWLIKVADKTSNVNDLIHDPPDWGRSAKLGYTKSAKKLVDVVRDLNDNHVFYGSVRYLISQFDVVCAEAMRAFKA
jgi:guanosine-3',5'-bis(diphosphate) 3'-pyrophosphohydrolase